MLVLAEALAIVILLPTSWSQAVGNGDGAEYQRYAFSLLHHGVFSEAPAPPYHAGVVRSPSYPSFLAALEWIGGRQVVVVQGALLAATSVLVGLIGRAVSRPAVGNLAAILCATYLPFLVFATVFLTETLATFLLTAVVLLLSAASPDRRSGAVGGDEAVQVAVAWHGDHPHPEANHRPVAGRR